MPNECISSDVTVGNPISLAKVPVFCPSVRLLPLLRKNYIISPYISTQISHSSHPSVSTPVSFRCPPLPPPPKLAKSWLPYSSNPHARWALGVEVYSRLFSRHPEIVPLFRCADMDSLSKRLSDLLQIVAMSFGDMWTVRETQV